MRHRIHLVHDVIPARVPDGAARVRDMQPEGRWVCVETVWDEYKDDGKLHKVLAYKAGSRMNGYGLVHSAKNMPEVIKYRCREIEIELKDGRWISTKTGRATNPAYSET